MADVAVPVGINAPLWTTVAPERTVLVVVHNLTTLTRLLDVVGIFDADFRVQVVMTSSLSDPFSRGLPDVITGLGYVFVPWRQATQIRFDLIVSASHHGHLGDLHGPLIVMPHGIGHPKYPPPLPQNGKNAYREPFGLSRQWLLYDGVPLASALLLSHPEQIERLRNDVPEAAHLAVLAGDPCYDRMLASLHRRPRYRAALGAGDGRRLIVTTTTWSGSSLLGSWPTLLRQLLAELPADEYRVVAITHPNAVQAHGEAQLRSWFADCLRAGLTLVPSLEGWRAALIAADLVIGDHGSVSCYGAALGRPVLLANFPDERIVPGTAVHRLGERAPRLQRGRALRPQIERALETAPPEGIAELVSAAPGEAAARIRATAYRLLTLPEPGHHLGVKILPTDGLTGGQPPTALWVHCRIAGNRVTVTRFPADVRRADALPPTDEPTHLAMHRDHPDRAAADVVFDDDVDGLTAEPPLDPAVLASVAYSWRGDLDGVIVEVGAREYRIRSV